MGLSGGKSCIKYLLFAFNLVFFIIGIALLGVGIYQKVGDSDYIDVAEGLTSLSKYVTVGNLMIAVGVIIVLVAFFGCFGAIRENRCMLLTFFIALFIIFILELAVAITGFVKKDDIEEQMEADFKLAISTKYRKDTSTKNAINKIIDDFQRKFDCCGYEDWRDWKDSLYYNETKLVPASCCIKEDSQCPTNGLAPDTTVYHNKGCFKEVMTWFTDNAVKAGACGIAFAVVQIIGLVMAFVLYRSVGESENIA